MTLAVYVSGLSARSVDHNSFVLSSLDGLEIKESKNYAGFCFFCAMLFDFIMFACNCRNLPPYCHYCSYQSVFVSAFFNEAFSSH